MSARWRYILQEAMIGLRRNLMMTVAVILSVTVSLTLLGASLLLSRQVDLAAGDWADKIEVSIFLCDGRQCADITTEQRAELEASLEAETVVQDVFYESKQEAYERFRDQFKDEPELIETVTPDALPASFRVKLEDPEQFGVIRDKYQAWPGVEDIIDQREVLEEFLKFANVIQKSALTVAIIQLIAASVLIANTIRVAAFARREQTSVMKLVGASNWYIRLPFVLEGVLAGFGGALVSWLLLLVTVPQVTDNLRDDIEFVAFIGTTDAVAIALPLFAAGILIAALSSVFALRRFLDV
ncbi:MAG: permease-like cell division protein FtsX [Actinobacteria bacterium]|nr:permease-like cell division protein FtsX [Actinomycetota bacterium]